MKNEKALIDNAKIRHVSQKLKYYLDGGFIRLNHDHLLTLKQICLA